MNAVSRFVHTTIGKKVMMATSGLIMIAWLFLHMAGNLGVFAGQDAYNHYAHFIQSGFGIEPAVLWLMRLFMAAMLVVHVASAVALGKVKSAARPTRYAGGRKNRVTSPAAIYMLQTGGVVALYAVFHLLHLTVGVWSQDALMPVEFHHVNAYANLVSSLGVWYVGLFYIIANLALLSHLSHGVWSAFQTLGVSDPRWEPYKVALGKALPVIIVGGNAIIALACMLHLLPSPDPAWAPPAWWGL